MLMSFDVKFIRLSQKMHRNGEAEPLHVFWSSLIIFISKDIYMVFYCIMLYLPCSETVKISA